MHIQASVEGRVCKKTTYNGCLVRTENSITWDNCLASLGEPYPRDGIFNLHLATIKDLYNPPVS